MSGKVKKYRYVILSKHGSLKSGTILSTTIASVKKHFKEEGSLPEGSTITVEEMIKP